MSWWSRQTSSQAGRIVVRVTTSDHKNIQVTINGERRELPAGATVADLLIELGLESARVAVERNRAVIPRAEHASTKILPGDQLELVSIVGGG
jgi:thiamine biosynthesis protein ThiS